MQAPVIPQANFQGAMMPQQTMVPPMGPTFPSGVSPHPALPISDPTAAERSKKRRNQCPVRHWYREGLQLRRGIISLPIDVNTVLYEPIEPEKTAEGETTSTTATATTTTTNTDAIPQMTMSQPPQKITSEPFENSQMSIVREFCIKNKETTFKPQQIGYIYAEKSVSGQVAAAPPPSDFDKYGLPINHLKYPVVILYENHWYLPCSLNDKCRIHHDLFFKRDPFEAAKRFVPYQIAKKAYPWDDIARSEASRRFGGDATSSLGTVVGLHNICVPPSDTNARSLHDLFPDYTEDRTIWHLPITPTNTNPPNNSTVITPTEGVCSLVPVSRLRKEDIRMFLAVVMFQGGNVWIPTMEFIEVPLHVANPCQQYILRSSNPRQQSVAGGLPIAGTAQSQQSSDAKQGGEGQSSERREVMSPPGCMKKIEQLLLSPQSTSFSTVQTWPSVKALLEAAEEKIDGECPQNELVVLKTSPTKVIRVVFNGKFRLKSQTVRSLEEMVAINLPLARVRIDCPDLAGSSVCIECYTQADTGSWIETSEKDNVGVVVYDNGDEEEKKDDVKKEKVVSSPLVITQKFCRCDFVYAPEEGVGSCSVICGPNDLINESNTVIVSPQRSTVQNKPEVTAVVTASVIAANSAADPSASKLVNKK